ncbi:dipeptide epimerase [Xanthomonas phaseoli]|uniref:Dipeptide epimerase n=1 Tax=Xanthomonas manihotis TaxID=43353 RepID=A0A8I1XLK6_XANMN|nr:dipeptide epimerase [Xanthomonas phaseoli]RWU14372.1 dipeptide epimerase [Xanthomonas phaseoli pv. manihotis str. CIO151]KUF23652.1 L-alanine-DL-glutamate epimerase [Xanthomonas phaseoli pv. manihotis]MBO9720526.1 dipeptide epimerase [Xanthomonas phaseoli pv. manihotis]MBO9756400.1 dipeptide epimerase [Xanthomonas phaseoli pv. manihotis]MBO9760178.1 dipeptide epimerase [Xanthomonas phaseoli pv. manihotis]
MKITGFRLGMLRVPLKTPFKPAVRTVQAIEDVVVLLQTDSGHIGYGAAPATAPITGDTHGSIIAAIEHCIGPKLIGQDVADLNRLCGRVQHALERNTSAKAAVEIALYDLWAQAFGAPLYQLLGGGTPRVTTDITISVDAIDTMVAQAQTALARGYRALKIKVGKDIESDVERVTAIHAAVAGRASLRLDANQGWTPKQAVRTMRTLEDGGIALELLEQPVKAADLDGLAFVTARIDTPVMADESVFSPTQVIELIQRRAADIINIKLMKTGGLSNAIRIADIAGLYGLPCMIGCMIESSISVAAAVHLAVAKADSITLADLDAPALGQFDPTEGGAHFDQAQIHIDDSPGLGIRRIRGLELLPA